MAEVKIVAASIINFLKQQLESESLSADSRESVEVGVQCIETAFELTPKELSEGVDLLQLVKKQKGGASPADRAEAEKLKNEGNEFMKAERHKEALEKYTRAIELDPQNSVFFCNRAAAHFKLGQHEAAVADATAALGLQPDYGKAYGRLGIALVALDRHSEARNAFARAVQLEPDNESYKENLKMSEERLSERGERPIDLGGLLQSPALLTMATEMLADPNMQHLISGLMTANGAGGLLNSDPAMTPSLLEAGQALAQQMQAANPELVEQLRRQVRPPGAPAPGAPAPGSQPPPAQ